MTDILSLSAAEIIAAIHAGEIDSYNDCFSAYQQEAANDQLGAFTWVAGREEQPELVRAPIQNGSQQKLAAVQAQENLTLDNTLAVPQNHAALSRLRDKPLAGVPLAVKDLFCTAGVPSQAGSRILAGYRPPYTATVIQRLLDAGVILLGKTNQDEFAMGSSNEHSAYGPVANPWDRQRVPGGSSGGSAAAVAGGLAPWAIGTDTGGSIRQPAAFCGIVGLKPTYGSVSRFGMIAFASSLDQAGPLTRDVTDAALLLKYMVGCDERDATSIGLPGPVQMPTRRSLEGLKLGVPKELSGEGIDPGVREQFEQTLALARELGATVELCELPHAPHALSAYYILAPAECSSNLSRFDGVRYGFRAEADDSLSQMYTETRHDGFGAEVKRRIMLGTFALSSGYYDAYYGRAQRVRTLIANDFKQVFDRFDAIVTPTTPSVAFKSGAKMNDPWQMYMNDYCTVPMSLAGIPAISIPNGLDDGLPTGFQIAGPAFAENTVLDIAFALEQALGVQKGMVPQR